MCACVCLCRIAVCMAHYRNRKSDGIVKKLTLCSQLSTAQLSSEALTFVIVSVWLALAVPFVLPTTLVHSKLLDCFEPSVTSSVLCCCERFHKIRTTQYDSRIKIVNKIPKNIGDSCIAPLSTAETTPRMKWETDLDRDNEHGSVLIRARAQ